MSHKTRKIAISRLVEKTTRINDTRERLEAHLDSLNKLDKQCDEVFKDLNVKVSRSLEELETALENRKTSLLDQISIIKERKASLLTQRKKLCQDVIFQSNESSALANQLLASKEQDSSSLIRQYSLVSQTLEDSLINSLTLLEDTSYESISTVDPVSVNINTDVILEIFAQGLDSIEKLLTKLNKKLDDIAKELPVINEPVKYDLNLSFVEEQPSPHKHTTCAVSTVAVPDLVFELATQLHVLILSAPTLTMVCAQPFGEDLVGLSSILRDYVLQCMVREDIVQITEQFLAELKVGHYCCSQFSVDQCWYRGRVIDINREHENVCIQYIDYGNEELVPFSSLLPLPPFLSSLPAQALFFTISGLTLPVDNMSSQFISCLHHWYEMTLMGSVVLAVTSTAKEVTLFVAKEKIQSNYSISFLNSLGLKLPVIESDEHSVNFGSVVTKMLSSYTDPTDIGPLDSNIIEPSEFNSTGPLVTKDTGSENGSYAYKELEEGSFIILKGSEGDSSENLTSHGGDSYNSDSILPFNSNEIPQSLQPEVRSPAFNEIPEPFNEVSEGISTYNEIPEVRSPVNEVPEVNNEVPKVRSPCNEVPEVRSGIPKVLPYEVPKVRSPCNEMTVSTAPNEERCSQIKEEIIFESKERVCETPNKILVVNEMFSEKEYDIASNEMPDVSSDKALIEAPNEERLSEIPSNEASKSQGLCQVSTNELPNEEVSSGVEEEFDSLSSELPVLEEQEADEVAKKVLPNEITSEVCNEILFEVCNEKSIEIDADSLYVFVDCSDFSSQEGEEDINGLDVILPPPLSFTEPPSCSHCGIDLLSCDSQEEFFEYQLQSSKSSPLAVLPQPLSLKSPSPELLSPTSQSPVPSSSPPPTLSLPVSPLPVSPPPASSLPVSPLSVSPPPASSLPVSPLPVSPPPASSLPVSPLPVSPPPASSLLVSPLPVSPPPASSLLASPLPVSPPPVLSLPALPLPVSPPPASSLPALPLPVSPPPASSLPALPLPVSSLPVSSLPVSPLPVSSLPVSPPPVSSLPVSPLPVSPDSPPLSSLVFCDDRSGPRDNESEAISEGIDESNIGFSTSGAGVNGGSSSGAGVNGGSSSGAGVNGGSSSGAGVDGGSSSGAGVNGGSSSGAGVNGGSSSGAGVDECSSSGTGDNECSSSGTGVDGCSSSGTGVDGCGYISFVDLSIGSEYSLIIAHIISPSLFYVFPKTTALSLQSLEDSLHSYFSSDCHQVPNFNDVQVGRVFCIAVPNLGGVIYCRALVLSFKKVHTSRPCMTGDHTSQSIATEDYTALSVTMESQSTKTGHTPLSIETEGHTSQSNEICCTSQSTETKGHTSQSTMTVDHTSRSITTNDQSSIIVEVFCVDYGFTCEVKGSELLILEEQFISAPAQCIACTLANVSPNVLKKNGSGENETSELSLESGQKLMSSDMSVKYGGQRAKEIRRQGMWTMEASNYFSSLVEGKLLVGVVKDIQDTPITGPVYSLFLYDTNDKEDQLINSLLIEAGVAFYTEDESPCTNDGPEDNGGEWDPMTADYLSSRNVYSVDDEDVNSALLGYRSSSDRKVCRFYNSLEGCANGEECRFLHLPDGVSDQCIQDTYTSPSLASLPSVGSLVVVLVTAVQSITCFMVQIIGPAETLVKTSSSSRFVRSKFLTLLKEMDRHYHKEGRISKYFVSPNFGELIAVWCERDGHWYRAIPKDQKENEIQVFYIDIGYEEWVGHDKIRSILSEFVHLPGQAIECTLYGTELNIDRGHSRTIFESYVKNKLLLAKVMWKHENCVLGVQLYQMDSEGQSLNEILTQEQYVKPKPKEKSNKIVKRLVTDFKPG